MDRIKEIELLQAFLFHDQQHIPPCMHISSSSSSSIMKPMERGWKPHVEISPTCPRCGSSNTKFCYFNNYSLTQPRYFCKGCRRYWTKGGALRNVPIGGGCRKSRRGGKTSLRDVLPLPLLPFPSRAGGPVVTLGHSGTPIPASLLSPSANGSRSSLPRTDQANGSSNDIDFALVYANFFNPKPINKAVGVEAEENNNNYHHHPPHIDIPLMLPSAPLSLQFSSQENCFSDQCWPLSDPSSEVHFSCNPFFLSGLDPIDKQTDFQFSTSMEDNGASNYGLPPFPGDELTTTTAATGSSSAFSQGLAWSASSSGEIFPNHHAVHVTHQFSGIDIESSAHAANEPQINPLHWGEYGSQFNVPLELCNIFGP